jgi:hypothetical protein
MSRGKQSSFLVDCFVATLLAMTAVTRSIIGALALLPVGAATASAAALVCHSQPRTEAAVLATEDAWVAAILDPSFADTSWRGELISRGQVLDRLPGRPESKLTLSDVHAVLIGNVAIVRGVNSQSDRGRAIGSVRFVDVFAYRSGRWQAVSAQESLIQPR